MFREAEKSLDHDAANNKNQTVCRKDTTSKTRKVEHNESFQNWKNIYVYFLVIKIIVAVL